MIDGNGLYEWLKECPTEWEDVTEYDGYIRITFLVREDEEVSDESN